VTPEIVNNVAEDLGLATVGLTLSSADDQQEEPDDELDDIEIIFDGLEEK
jgi:hypothetical protein